MQARTTTNTKVNQNGNMKLQLKETVRPVDKKDFKKII